MPKSQLKCIVNHPELAQVTPDVKNEIRALVHRVDFDLHQPAEGEIDRDRAILHSAAKRLRVIQLLLAIETLLAE